jgi:hypothetical protein
VKRRPGRWHFFTEPPLLTIADVDTSKILHRRMKETGLDTRTLKRVRKIK